MSRYRGSRAPEGEDTNRNRLFGNRAVNPYSPQAGGYVAGNSYSSQGEDTNRNRLFGNRTANSYSPQAGGYAAGNSYSSQGSGYSGAPLGSGGGTGYGSSYGHTQHGSSQSGTSQHPEDDDERAIREMQGQIAHDKAQTRDSTKRALAAAQLALDSGLETSAHLTAQGERLSNAQKNLNLASNQNDLAKEKALALEHATRGLFVPNLKGKFRSSSRVQEEETRIISRNQQVREERDEAREFGYQSKTVAGSGLGTTTGCVESEQKARLAERSLYQFGANPEDDRLEDEIDDNLDKLGVITGRLKGLALANGRTVERQNEQIDKIIKKSDRVDDQIALNHNRLRKIH